MKRPTYSILPGDPVRFKFDGRTIIGHVLSIILTNKPPYYKYTASTPFSRFHSCVSIHPKDITLNKNGFSYRNENPDDIGLFVGTDVVYKHPINGKQRRGRIIKATLICDVVKYVVHDFDTGSLSSLSASFIQLPVSEALIQNKNWEPINLVH